MWFYDASTETKKSNPSLNECLHIGPVILDCICGLLMRFRTKNIGLQPKERDVARFLRLTDVNLPVTPTNIINYCFTRVLFGIISRPLLFGATIKHYLESGNQTGECNIHRDIYVDNLPTGVNNQEEGSRLYETIKSKFKEISLKPARMEIQLQ